MKKAFIVSGILFIICSIIFFSFIFYINPSKDTVEIDEQLPSTYLIENENNYIDYQINNECAADSAAYILRHLGISISGSELNNDVNRIFGFVSYHSITEILKKEGYDAVAYSGNAEMLKYRLNQGVPIIVFTKIPNDTHYMVLVGYDEEYFYLVDSISENSNVENTAYNRKIETDKFLEIWKNNIFMKNNIYIVVK